MAASTLVAQTMRIFDKAEETLALFASNLSFSFQTKGNSSYLNINDKNYPILVKGQVQMSLLPQILDQKTAAPELILAAEHIPRTVKAALRDSQINYLDSLGNMFLQLPDNKLIIYINDKKEKNIQPKHKDLAFTKKGLIVVFHLLSNPDLVNESQRTIQQISATSLDTVNKVFASLKAQGFIRKKNEKEFRLDLKRNLFLKWIDAYEQRLKPSLLAGRYRFQNVEKERDWHKLELNEASFWGGEPGADLLTNYLQPAVFQLYSTETKMDLMKNYRFIPDPKGNIYVHVPFGENLVTVKRTNPLLVYADLVNSGDYRNLEVAERINDAYLKTILD